MNRLTVAVVAMSTAAWATEAWPQTGPAGGGFQAKQYFEIPFPLENDASRQVRLQSVIIPAGGGNQFHRHPGEQWWAVQEGEVVYTIKGQPPRVLKAGDYVYVPRGTIHRNQNLTNKPARSIELDITDKDKPQTERVPD